MIMSVVESNIINLMEIITMGIVERLFNNVLSKSGTLVLSIGGR